MAGRCRWKKQAWAKGAANDASGKRWRVAWHQLMAASKSNGTKRGIGQPAGSAA